MRNTVLLADCVERICQITDTSIPDVIEALTGVVWDEEYAGRLLEYHQGEDDL